MDGEKHGKDKGRARVKRLVDTMLRRITEQSSGVVEEGASINIAGLPSRPQSAKF